MIEKEAINRLEILSLYGLGKVLDTQDMEAIDLILNLYIKKKRGNINE